LDRPREPVGELDEGLVPEIPLGLLDVGQRVRHVADARGRVLPGDRPSIFSMCAMISRRLVRVPHPTLYECPDTADARPRAASRLADTTLSM